jgi:hypothetical protein
MGRWAPTIDVNPRFVAYQPDANAERKRRDNALKLYRLLIQELRAADGQHDVQRSATAKDRAEIEAWISEGERLIERVFARASAAP